jgi:hypothetical protein
MNNKLQDENIPIKDPEFDDAYSVFLGGIFLLDRVGHICEAFWLDLPAELVC